MSRAVWMEKHGYLEVKPMNKYKKYMKDRGWHAKKFAAEVGVSVNSLYKIMAGTYSGKAERKGREYMDDHPPVGTLPLIDAAIDAAKARAVMGWATEMIDAGKVKSIEIRMEVGE